MNYKEKYDKLVEAVKVLQEANPSDEGIQNWVNDNVPELAESEDESTRKRIITLVNAHGQGRFKESMLAWLEKQGTSYTKRDVDDAYVEGMAFAKDELEKQKPTWSKKDEEIVTGIINDIQERLEDYPIEQLADIYFKEIKWLKSLKERYTWKPSKEQLKFLQHYADQNNYDGTVLTSLLNDLKKL